MTIFLQKQNNKPHSISFIQNPNNNQITKNQIITSSQNCLEMKLTCQHIACNCNPMPHAFDFLTESLIVFCYKNQLGLYSLEQSCILRNIHPSKQPYPNRANCVKTFTKDNKYYVLVGYDSGDLVLYGTQDFSLWRQIQWIKQKHSILGITLYNQSYAAVQNNDALVTFYSLQRSEKNEQELKSFSQIQFPLNKTIETISLTKIGQNLIIFLGSVDQNIYCYSKSVSKKQEQPKYHFSLTGHQNSITKIAINQVSQGQLLLASASKDGYIRLWKLTKDLTLAKFHKNVKTISNNETNHYVFLDSVLISHECSVTFIHWARFNDSLRLLSSSLDSTLCIWGQIQENGSWSVETRMGQFLGNKNAYFQIMSNSSNTCLAALNYIGSILIWNYDQKENKFTLRESFNGHYSEVKDISWNYSGDFLVSVSKDQTTRVLAQNIKTQKYHEISRAQIHGYDINTVCLLKTKDQVFDIIACGADQKVVRILEPPACFANYFNSFTHKNFHLFFNSEEQENKYLLPSSLEKDSTLLYETYTEGGGQVLGLMTKVQRVEREKVVDYYNEDDEEALDVQEEKVDIKQTKKIDFSVPPHDDYLVKHTLWPEMNKLYGHPHELQCICRSPDSKFMATSCKALTKETASIIIWSTQTWKIFKIVPHHAYTVYSMEYSRSGKYLTSVSKDRKLALFDTENYDLIMSYEAHTRAITSVSISSDEKFIVTGSRDKTIKIHSIAEKKAIAQYEFKTVVTAVAYCRLEGKWNIICCGMIDGTVTLVSWTTEKGFQILGEVDHAHGHTQRINAIRWNFNRFATCSDDHSVGIFKIQE